MTTAPEQSTAKGWTPDDSTFGARLALIRQRMGWGNVREAAVECGLPPESWRTWERDNVTPRKIVEIAGVISRRTGCDYGWLLAGPRLRGIGEVNEHYAPGGRSVEVKLATPLQHRPIGGGRREPTRPPSTKRGNKIRPGNTRPALLPRAS